MYDILGSFPAAKLVSTTVWLVKPSSGPSSAPVPPPSYQGPSVIPRPKHPHHDHRHRSMKPYAVAPSPSEDQVINELEIEVASGTYLKQSQVRIMGVSPDIQNPGRAIVDINLVPLGEKFDNTTAVLTYERFWHKKVPLNRSLFGDYTVLSATYPGMPSPPPHGTLAGCGPDHRESEEGIIPFTADFISKSEKMSLRTIIIIALSSILLLVVLVGALSIFFKWRKIRRPSSSVGPGFTSSLNKRSAMESMLSSRITSSRSMSLVSTMATSILSVKTFSFSELEKATDKFSSQRVLGEGGFGRVYHGTLDDGSDVAVKLLTRDNQNGDRGFIVEVEMLCRLHHRNLVKLIGICIQGRRRCLVYELVRNGSVESHLHGNWYHIFFSSGVTLHRLVVNLMGITGADGSRVYLENLVTWARPLLTSREGLEQLVDPSLAGSYDFDDMAKVAAIASMCVHPEVTQRPFMGEVVQALKLIYNDRDETSVDCCSWKESSESDFRDDIAFYDSSRWNIEGLTPRLAYGQPSSFITMEYSSGPLEGVEKRHLSASSLIGDEMPLPIRDGNRSGPLRTSRSKLSFYRFTGSLSEHGILPSKRVWNDGNWP
ncbi:Serine-threonine/tyrosine-protein kinase, catalytic domain [Sesbania bispinosa]|nr:Serine-threonine/tyrosine-protein kinase, catalytic domain [Sesbania bispinosa]